MKIKIEDISVQNIRTALNNLWITLPEAKARFKYLHRDKTKDEIDELFYEFLTKENENEAA